MREVLSSNDFRDNIVLNMVKDIPKYTLHAVINNAELKINLKSCSVIFLLQHPTLTYNYIGQETSCVIMMPPGSRFKLYAEENVGFLILD